MCQQCLQWCTETKEIKNKKIKKKQSKDNTIKNVRNLYRLKKENEVEVMRKSNIAVLLFKTFKNLPY